MLTCFNLFIMKPLSTSTEMGNITLSKRKNHLLKPTPDTNTLTPTQMLMHQRVFTYYSSEKKKSDFIYMSWNFSTILFEYFLLVWIITCLIHTEVKMLNKIFKILTLIKKFLKILVSHENAICILKLTKMNKIEVLKLHHF